MKNLKKLPSKQLEKLSTIFMQLGLVLTLFVVYITLEHQTLEKSSIYSLYERDNTNIYDIDDTYPIIYKKIAEVKKPEIKLPKPKISSNLSKIDKINNNDIQIIESVIDKPTNNRAIVLNPDNIIEAFIDNPVEEDVPFLKIEEAPIYRGCEGLSKEENKKCFVKKITKHVQKYFNSSISENIGLHSGKYKIYAQFVINKLGEIVNLKIRAPHKRLEKEAQRVVDKIPQFIPGKQRGESVKVKYILPIIFRVE